MRAFTSEALNGIRVRFQRQAVAGVDEPPAAESVAQPAGRSEPRPWARAINPAFILILLAGTVLRMAGLNWDQGTHIHPDERFLTMLGTGVSLPSSIFQYFDPATSPLSPYNNSSYGAMVYGMLPVTLNKVLALVFQNGDFGGFTIQGRALSALADIGTLVFVYLIVRLLAGRGILPARVAYLAAAFYAIAVFPIQTSHFFTVDTFLNFFAWASLYFALRYAFGGAWLAVVASGVLLGFSLASKVTGVYMAPLIVYFLICRPIAPDANPAETFSWLRRAGKDWKQTERTLEDVVFGLIVFAVAGYLGLRVGAPYYFESANFLDPRLGHSFLSNLQQLNSFNDPNAWYPPGVQWIHKPALTFGLVNLAVFGLGVPFFLAAVAGAYVTVARLIRSPLSVFLLWTLALFLYQSVQYDKTMRYFILIYPALAIFAAIGLGALLLAVPRYIAPVLAIAIIIWPLAFMSIYTRDLSRVSATKWMYQHIPNGSIVINESWDDPLPLQGVDNNGKYFASSVGLPANPKIRQLIEAGKYPQNGTLSLSMPSFDPDNASKWAYINYLLKRGRYLVLSSNRGWGSMPTVPSRYPKMTRFYADLFAGKTAYRLVAQFTSYPSLRYLGIPIDFPDQWSEEAFTVYDHPEVLIFEHVR